MSNFLLTLKPFLTMFAGPIGQALTNGLTVASGTFVAWQVRQGIPADLAGTIGAAAVGAVAFGINMLTGTQIVHIAAVNGTKNGVRVVETAAAKAANIPQAQAPLS